MIKGKGMPIVLRTIEASETEYDMHFCIIRRPTLGPNFAVKLKLMSTFAMLVKELHIVR